MEDDKYNLEADYLHDMEMDQFNSWKNTINTQDMFIVYCLESPFVVLEHDAIKAIFEEQNYNPEYEDTDVKEFIKWNEIMIYETLKDEWKKYFDDWLKECWNDKYK